MDEKSTMSRVFAYCRVSTADQETQNQVIEIQNAGFAIHPRRIIEERVSGSVAAKERAGFCKLIDRLEPDDVLVVTKLDRLGRNAMDVRATVEQLDQLGVRVHCLGSSQKHFFSKTSKNAVFRRFLLLVVRTYQKHRRHALKRFL